MFPLTPRRGGAILRAKRTVIMALRLLSLIAAAVLTAAPLMAADADLILHTGKIVTVDATFSIAEAALGRTAYRRSRAHSCVLAR